MFGDKKIKIKDSERSLISETVSIEGTINSSGAIDVAGLIKGPVYSKELIVRDTVAKTVKGVNCLLIIKLELDVSTLEITFLGNFEKIPEFSKFKTLGTLILNVDEVSVIVPVLTPTTFVVADKVNIFPLLEILAIPLNVGSW